jgi:hypothetical protein
MNRLIPILIVGFALVPTMASAQTAHQIDEARRRQENQIILGITGARMRQAGQTIAQKTAQSKADAEAKRRAKYKKYHRSLVVDREHPKTESKSAPKK